MDPLPTKPQIPQPPIQQPPTPQLLTNQDHNPLQSESPKNKNTVIVATTAIVLIFFLSVIIIINGQRNTHVLTLPAQQQSTTAEATPTPITTDTAPALPTSQKAKVIVHHSDSSFETFLVPTNNIELFKKSLQTGDTISQIINPTK